MKEVKRGKDERGVRVVLGRKICSGQWWYDGCGSYGVGVGVLEGGDVGGIREGRRRIMYVQSYTQGPQQEILGR